jgi:polyhydroxyalkanoate synthesis regulator phasin
MTTNDLIKRMIDAGLTFTQMTQARAEEIARDLQESGSVRFDEVQSTVQELMERGRENTEQLMSLIQREVSKQLAAFGVDVKDLEARVEELQQRYVRGWPTKARPAKKAATAKAAPVASSVASSTTTKSTAKKSTAKRSTAKKATAKKATARKSTAKRSAAKRSPAKKSTAKRSTTKKRAAKKTAAKKTASG